MKEILLIKNGEIALKGLNRATFESILIKNIRRRLKPLGDFKIERAQSTVYVVPVSDDFDMEEAVNRIKKIFGIAAFHRAWAVEKDYAAIEAAAQECFSDILEDASTFKVEAKRADKRFPIDSPAICRELGGTLLARYPHLRVDVHHPEVTITVEVREREAYLHAGSIPGAGGMPVGGSGKVLLLLSGGIDSPVAGYMMAKRGLEVGGIHFAAPPYTSDRALQKVETLGEKMSEYCGRIPFYCVPFTKLQEAIRDHCPEEYFTIIMRRMMMRIASQIAARDRFGALVTGESVGQVASQTLQALCCTDAVCDLPVFRPVIGMDKSEIVSIARRIDTYETSILPYEDCCTVFTPRHPKTRPRLAVVEAAEAAFDFAPLIQKAAEDTAWKLLASE